MADKHVIAEAHAGLGIVNAIGSGGFGAATALDLWLRLEAWRCSSSRGYVVTRGERVEVARDILDSVTIVVSEYAGRGLPGLCTRGWSEIPLEAGLKGSSALINALILAALELTGTSDPGPETLARLGVRAARLAGLTVTGALDDHLVVSGCGTYLTDNPGQRVLGHLDGPERFVAIIVPGRRSIRSIEPEQFRAYAPLYLAAWRLLEKGEWGPAALVNGVATSLATNTSPRTLVDLVGMGAETAGVSGKGPAIYAATETREKAEKIAAIMQRKHGGEALVARTIPCTALEEGEPPS